MNGNSQTLKEFVLEVNAQKKLFTAGPASLLQENLEGLRPCFGRGDADYLNIEISVLDALRKISGHKFIVRLQGSASLALEIMALNFLYGKVLIIDSGYYSDRLILLANAAMKNLNKISEINTVEWREIDSISGKYDWVWACSTETSAGTYTPIQQLSSLAKRTKSKLMLDATASIGLESDHEYADVLSFSSCKGLFGLTGAAFISFNEFPEHEPPNSFNLSLISHYEKKMTGPYHAILSLDRVLARHAEIRESVVINKKIFLERMKAYVDIPDLNQPLLCTHVNVKLISSDPRAILYSPRSNIGGSVVCHLGEAHLGIRAEGNILNALKIAES